MKSRFLLNIQRNPTCYIIPNMIQVLILPLLVNVHSNFYKLDWSKEKHLLLDFCVCVYHQRRRRFFLYRFLYRKEQWVSILLIGCNGETKTMMKKETKTVSRYIKSEGECANSHAIIQKQTNNNKLNCVNNKMLEHDWLLTTLIYGLIGCFMSKLSDLTCPITNICNRTGQIGKLSSQSWQSCKRNLNVASVNIIEKFTAWRVNFSWIA